MRTESKEPLFCRCCGKSLPKWSKTVYVKDAPGKFDHKNTWSRYVYVGDAPLSSKADCQRRTNGIVLSVKYADEKVGPESEVVETVHRGPHDYVTFKDPRPSRRVVRSFNEWDGVTYADDLFCTGTCAESFGRAMSNLDGKPYGTGKWREAVARAKERKAS